MKTRSYNEAYIDWDFAISDSDKAYRVYLAI